jgi:hypothetical protein
MKAITTILLTLLVLGGCTITGVYTDKFWTDKFYQLKGTSITDVIKRIGLPSSIIQMEEFEVYLFESIQKDFVGRSPVCELKLQVNEDIISLVDLTGSEGSCSKFGLK